MSMLHVWSRVEWSGVVCSLVVVRCVHPDLANVKLAWLE